jgi:hypothetical protein
VAGEGAPQGDAPHEQQGVANQAQPQDCLLSGNAYLVETALAGVPAWRVIEVVRLRHKGAKKRGLVRVMKQVLASGRSDGESGARHQTHPRGGKRGHSGRCHSGGWLRTLLGWVTASGRRLSSD